MANKKPIRVLSLTVLLMSALGLASCSNASSTSSTNSSSSNSDSSVSTGDGSSKDSTGTSSNTSSSDSSNPPVSQYTVTFDANGHGTAPSQQTINSGSKVTEPTALTASGYTFGGWYKEATCQNAWNFATDTVSANMTLYAKWTQVENKLVSIALDASSAQPTSFIKGEAFSSSGIVVKGTYNEGTATLTSEQYTIDSSAYVAGTLGTYKITVTAVADTSIKLTYDVVVADYPFVGEWYEKSTIKEVTYDVTYFVMKISSDGNIYLADPTTGGYAEKGNAFTYAKNADGTIAITYSGTVTITYNPTAKTIVSGENTYHYFDSEKQVRLTGSMNGNTSYIVINKNGGISQVTIDFIASMGYYISKTSDGTYADCVTATDAFSEDGSFYLLGIPVDYTGKAFVGKYYITSGNHNKVAIELTADGTIITIGSTVTGRYVAKADSSNWTISFGGNTAAFDTSAETLTSSGIVYHLVTSSMVVVTLTDGDGIDKNYKDWFSGQYVITSGDSFSLLFATYYAKLVLDKYTEGTAISAAASYTITSITFNTSGLPNGIKFGSYKNGYFYFDTENGTAYHGFSNGTIDSGSYTITDLSETTINLDLALNTGTISIVLDATSITVSSGTYAGTYNVGEYFKGMPFVGDFTNAETGTVTVSQSGSMSVYDESTQTTTDYDLALDSIKDSLYTFTATSSTQVGSTEYTVTFDSSTKVLTYNNVEYTGSTYMGEPYLGTFVYQGDTITIDQNGNVTIGGVSYTISKASSTSNGFDLTFALESTEMTATYTTSTDTLTYDSKTYSRTQVKDTSKLTGYDYTTGIFKDSEGTHNWHFDVYGFVYQDSVVIGHADTFTDTGFALTLNNGTVVEGGVTISLSNGVFSFSYGSVNYSFTEPKVTGLAFVDQTYTDESKNTVIISSDDNFNYTNSTGTTVTGTVSSVVSDTEAGTITVTVALDDTSSGVATEWVYNTEAQTFTAGEATFSLSGGK